MLEENNIQDIENRLEELGLTQECIDWVMELDPERARMSAGHIAEIHDKIGWLPSHVYNGLWYQHSPGWYDDEILICSDGGYAIYQTLSIDGKPEEDWLKEEISTWSGELAGDGKDHAW